MQDNYDDYRNIRLQRGEDFWGGKTVASSPFSAEIGFDVNKDPMGDVRLLDDADVWILKDGRLECAEFQAGSLIVRSAEEVNRIGDFQRSQAQDQAWAEAEPVSCEDMASRFEAATSGGQPLGDEARKCGAALVFMRQLGTMPPEIRAKLDGNVSYQKVMDELADGKFFDGATDAGFDAALAANYHFGSNYPRERFHDQIDAGTKALTEKLAAVPAPEDAQDIADCLTARRDAQGYENPGIVVGPERYIDLKPGAAFGRVTVLTGASVRAEQLFNENDTVGEVRPLEDGCAWLLEDGVMQCLEIRKGENLVLGHEEMSDTAQVPMVTEEITADQVMSAFEKRGRLNDEGKPDGATRITGTALAYMRQNGALDPESCRKLDGSILYQQVLDGLAAGEYVPGITERGFAMGVNATGWNAGTYERQGIQEQQDAGTKALAAQMVEDYSAAQNTLHMAMSDTADRMFLSAEAAKKYLDAARSENFQALTGAEDPSALLRGLDKEAAERIREYHDAKNSPGRRMEPSGRFATAPDEARSAAYPDGGNAMNRLAKMTSEIDRDEADKGCNGPDTEHGYEK